jgi:hypothetical protein
MKTSGIAGPVRQLKGRWRNAEEAALVWEKKLEMRVVYVWVVG